MPIDIDKTLRDADKLLYTAKCEAVEQYDDEALIVEHIADALASIEKARLLYADMKAQSREAVEA